MASFGALSHDSHDSLLGSRRGVENLSVLAWRGSLGGSLGLVPPAV